MSLGRNIHDAVVVVFETLKSIEKLMTKCRAELDEERFFMPAERFMRHSSDLSWDGWIYWSFILLFQRKEDGEPMENGWINGPVYAVEINIDSDTCDEPQLIVAKIDFGDLSDWSKGCSPANHGLFYNAIHPDDVLYEEKGVLGDITVIGPCQGMEEKVSKTFWGFKELKSVSHDLVIINQNNYKDIIFGTINLLSKK